METGATTNNLNWFPLQAQLDTLNMVEQPGLSLPLMETSTQYIKPPPYFDFLPKLWLRHNCFKFKSMGIHLVAKSRVQFYLLLIPAGLEQQAKDQSNPRRTSTASARSQCSPWTRKASPGSERSPPDLDCKR